MNNTFSFLLQKTKNNYFIFNIYKKEKKRKIKK